MSKSNIVLFRHVLWGVGSLLTLCTPIFSQARFSPSIGQTHADYYYFETRITLPVAPEWLSVKTKTLATTAKNSSSNSSQSHALQQTLSRFGASVKNASSQGVHLVKLSGPENVHALTAELAQHEEIALVAPVLLSGHVRQLVTDEFIVGIESALHESEFAQLAAAHEATIIRRLEEQVFQLRARSGKDGLQAANEFHQLHGIAFAQPNFIYPAEDLRAGIPNDAHFKEQWALQNHAQSVAVGDVNADGRVEYVNGVAGADVDAVRAWALTRGSAEIKIAVLDSGIDLDHPDLQANLLAGYDAVARDSIPNDDDVHGMGGHGTAVAGIIAAVADNGIGISGLAPHCRLIPIRVFDENTTDDVSLAAGIRAAVDLGADVLNNSWGGGSPSAVITEAIKYAHDNGRNGRGCTIVFASGNAGNGKVIYPASLAQVIAVGASNMFDEWKSAGSSDGQMKWGSNYGAALDVVAPTLVYTTDIAGSEGYSNEDYYRTFDGTSAACPHVAALAGLLLSLKPSLTAHEVQNLIEASCDKIGRYAYDVARPNGWWNARFGYGRINAYRALKLALGEDFVPPQIAHTPIVNVDATADLKISALIADASGIETHGASTSASGAPIPGEPSLAYRVNQGSGFSAWQFLNDQNGAEDQRFDFIMPQQAQGAQIEYYFAARDASSNKNSVTFPMAGLHEHAGEIVSPLQCLTFFSGELKHERLHSSEAPKILSAENSCVVSTLEVPASCKIADLDVEVDVRHNYLSDLILVLESPAGTRVALSSRNGEDEDDYEGTVFDDEAATPIAEGVPPYRGAFQPDENLAQFDGENAAGIWKLIVLDRVEMDGGSLESWGLTFSYAAPNSPPTQVGAAREAMPAQFKLYDSYPNPFKLARAEGKTPRTRITFDLPSHTRGTATLRVYNTLGQLVRTLVQRQLAAGKHEAWWDGKDETGRSVAAGTYLYVLQAGDWVGKKKLVVMR